MAPGGVTIDRGDEGGGGDRQRKDLSPPLRCNSVRCLFGSQGFFLGIVAADHRSSIPERPRLPVTDGSSELIGIARGPASWFADLRARGQKFGVEFVPASAGSLDVAGAHGLPPTLAVFLVGCHPVTPAQGQAVIRGFDVGDGDHGVRLTFSRQKFGSHPPTLC